MMAMRNLSLSLSLSVGARVVSTDFGKCQARYHEPTVRQGRLYDRAKTLACQARRLQTATPETQRELVA